MRRGARSDVLVKSQGSRGVGSRHVLRGRPAFAQERRVMPAGYVISGV